MAKNSRVLTGKGKKLLTQTSQFLGIVTETFATY